jgi:hypothetical protein
VALSSVTGLCRVETTSELGSAPDGGAGVVCCTGALGDSLLIGVLEFEAVSDSLQANRIKLAMSGNKLNRKYLKYLFMTLWIH